jgi:hypothetical protein
VSFLLTVVAVFLILFSALLLLLLLLGYLFSLFNWLDKRLGFLARPLFWLSFFVGLYLTVLAWGEADPVKGYIGALLVASSALYFLSEINREV